jgi:hypothetical protein
MRFYKPVQTGPGTHLDAYKMYLAELFFEWEMFQLKVVKQNQNTYFMFSNFFWKSLLLWEYAEKYGGAREATDDNMANAILCFIIKPAHERTQSYAHTPADTHTRKHTHTHTHTHAEICNTYSFLQQWLRVGALVLLDTYIVYLIASVCNMLTLNAHADTAVSDLLILCTFAFLEELSGKNLKP